MYYKNQQKAYNFQDNKYEDRLLLVDMLLD